VTLVHEEVKSLNEKNNYVEVLTNGDTYIAQHVFSSIIKNKFDKIKVPYVDQHFKGWIIETHENSFDEKSAYFMDFRIDQANETRFMYVLPFSKSKALIEVAIFSNEILDQDDYDKIIFDYINNILGIKKYDIEEEEFGIIPMTSADFSKSDTSRITHIGTAAGCVKPSSGYTFVRILEHNKAIIDCIRNKKPLKEAQKIFPRRFKLYDATMLNVIIKNEVMGAKFFTALFKLRKPKEIFKFLDQKTNFLEELKIMNLPFKITFMRSLIEMWNKV
jgi:lycopene beta-cyclase